MTTTQMTNELMTNEYGISDVDLEGLRDAFGISNERIKDVCDQYADLAVIDPADKTQVDLCREGRLELKRARVKIEKVHKMVKADALAYGKACDAEKNRLVGPLKTEEARLQAEENKHSEYLEAIQKEAEEKETARIDGLSKKFLSYGVALPYMELATMTDEEIDVTLAAAATDYQEEQDRIAAEEAARMAREDELAKEQALQVAKEAALEDERKSFEAEKKAFDDAKKAEEDAAAAVEAEKAENERLAAEQMARDEKRKADRERQEALAPGRQALNSMVDLIESAITERIEDLSYVPDGETVNKTKNQIIALYSTTTQRAKIMVESMA
jgi:hypothetical protein